MSLHIRRMLMDAARAAKETGLDWRWLERTCTETAIEAGLRKKRLEATGAGLERFAEFWDAYPKCDRKTNKPGCARKWAAAKLDSEADAILLGLSRLAVSESWVKSNGAYIPGPLVFLNQRRWDDVTQDADMFGLEGAL